MESTTKTADKKKVVIITGVSGGIGLATARLFAERGWLVVGTVRSRRYPAELAALTVDIQLAEMTRPADLRRVIERTLKTYGQVDALVPNAGYALYGPLESLTYTQVSEQLAVNTVAVIELARLVLPSMKQRRQGAIVALSSLVGRVGAANYGAYAASKFALEGFAESLWYELSGSGVKVRLVEPWPVHSAFWSHRVPGAGSKVLKPPPILLWRAIEPQDVADRIYQAATADSNRLRYPVGLTFAAALAKRLLPEQLFYLATRRFYGRSNQNPEQTKNEA